MRRYFLDFFMNKNLAVDETRKCTKCLAILPATEFYSKGNRTDSECKHCRKMRERAKYLARHGEASRENLKRVIDILASWKLKRIRELRKEIQKYISEGA